MYKAMHQSIRDSEKLANLSDFAFRVWDMACVASDLMGRITANPKKLWAQAMPMVPFDEAKYAAAIEELRGLVHLYEADGKKYMVFHDHDEHNKGSKNLRHQSKSKIPPPPPNLCYCITYQPHEEGDSTAVATAVPTAVQTAAVHVPVPVLVHVQRSEGGVGGGESKNGTVEAHIVSAWNRGPGFPISHPTGQRLVRAFIDSGVDAQKCEQAVSNQPACKGKKLWEVLEPLRPAQDNGVPSMDKILANLANEMRGK